jgi:hypothetical protein
MWNGEVQTIQIRNEQGRLSARRGRDACDACEAVRVFVLENVDESFPTLMYSPFCPTAQPQRCTITLRACSS